MQESYYEKKLGREIKKEIPEALYLKLVCPGFSGVPDRMILLPGGRIIFVELKRPGKTERPRQVFVQSIFRKLGFEVFSHVRNDEDIAAVVQRCREVLGID